MKSQTLVAKRSWSAREIAQLEAIAICGEREAASWSGGSSMVRSVSGVTCKLCVSMNLHIIDKEL